MDGVLHVGVQNAAANNPPRFLIEFIKCRVTRQLWRGLAAEHLARMWPT